MDASYKFPTSPGEPLFQVSPERVNQQRIAELPPSPSMPEFSTATKSSRESSVHERAAKFDTLAFQGKALERKTADAALKRAMLGREEAEAEMRRYREDVKILRKQLEEGRERERRVGERLESVMEKYGQAKETHTHTQQLWEKEIRRTRKESFKSQSVLVKLQEELKATRNSLRTLQSELEQERERTAKREEEAFTARYQLVGVQAELTAMSEQVKLVEQERDALRTVAKNEEVARIAAEGQIPLPQSNKDDEFSSPRKVSAPLPEITVKSSAATEEELQELRRQVEWEQQRAERAYDHLEYLRLECQFKCCSCRGFGNTETSNTEVPVSVKLEVPEDQNVEVKQEPTEEQSITSTLPERPEEDTSDDHLPLEKGRQTIFIPSEGVFRTIDSVPEESPWISPAKPAPVQHPVAIEQPDFQLNSFQLNNFQSDEVTPRPSIHARTPSCEPPDTAIFHPANTSMLSLIDGSTDPVPESPVEAAYPSHRYEIREAEVTPETRHYPSIPESEEDTPASEQIYHTVSTTIRVPLANPPDLTPPTLPESVETTFTPTMSREEALAQIRERRGRARSLAQGTATPRKQMIDTTRRDISAPAVRSAPRGRNLVRG